MKSTAQRWALVTILCGLAACDSGPEPLDLATYEAEVRHWRVARLANLKGQNGYLNLVGLYWLEDGATSIGSDAVNDLVFPANAAARIGVLETSPDGVRLNVEQGVEVLYQDIPVRSILIADDTKPEPVTLRHGSLAWTVILRDGRFALRLRDLEHPAIAAFPPIESYPIDPELRVVATMQPYDEPKIINVRTTIEGLGYNPESPGTLAFEIAGEQMDLEAYAAGDSLFFVFADTTSGKDTYPAGRFVYAEVPGKDGETILDFNLAYNPPCAFNAFATCPVASPRNRLKVAIEAGEKYDPSVHSVPDGY